jgi:hypothetical protein
MTPSLRGFFTMYPRGAPLGILSPGRFGRICRVDERILTDRAYRNESEAPAGSYCTWQIARKSAPRLRESNPHSPDLSYRLCPGRRVSSARSDEWALLFPCSCISWHACPTQRDPSPINGALGPARARRGKNRAGRRCSCLSQRVAIRRYRIARLRPSRATMIQRRVACEALGQLARPRS